MANVDPTVQRFILRINCEPNQEKDIPISHLDRRIKFAKQKYPNAKISIRIVSRQS